jgi:hypothetical protein
MKHRLATVLQDIATARGSLYPAGKRQERALNLIPLLSRYGHSLLDDMQVAAGRHAATVLDGPRESSASPSRMEAPSSSP